MILIKSVKIFAPEFLGTKDIFICGGKVVCIDDSLNLSLPNLKIINGSKFIATPGFIDKHIHITGGGGEGGFKTRVPEICLSNLIQAGITTAVGLLGTDSLTRSVENLVAKANALTSEGITCYAHTGAYTSKSPTITGDIGKDIVFIDSIIGTKLAISDHRSSSVSKDELAKIVSAGRVAGMIASKSGHTTLHMGDGKKGLGLIYEVLDEYDIPIFFFQPTHINRNQELFKQSFKFLKDGGFVDFTCGIPGLSPFEAVKQVKSQGIDTSKITISSDGYGSYSSYDSDGKLLKIGVSSIMSIKDEFIKFINGGFDISEALRFFTSSVANSIGVKKGRIQVGFDADMLLFDDEFNLEFMIAKGEILKDDKGFIKKGTYE